MCACTLCSCTMSLKDFPAHSQGRRHQVALSRVDANLETLPSSSRTTSAVNHGKNIPGRGLVGSNKIAPIATHSASLGVPGPATPPVSSLASETAKQCRSSTEAVKQVSNKAKRSKKVKQPKEKSESITTPPASTGLKNPSLNDSFPSNRQDKSKPNNLMCGQGCGWCGQSVNHLADAYVVPTCSLLTLSQFLS